MGHIIVTTSTGSGWKTQITGNPLPSLQFLTAALQPVAFVAMPPLHGLERVRR